MLALTFATGVIDAVGFLGLDRVFTGNMTGNVVILGMGVAGADDLPIVGPALALVGFMAGAVVAGRVLRAASAGWSARSTALTGGVALTMCSMAVLASVVRVDHGGPVSVVCSSTLAAAMGVQAAMARVVAVRDVTTVVVTSTITGLAADSWFGAGRGGGQARRFTAVALLILGALLGALMLRWHVAAGIALAGVVVAAVAVVGELQRRRVCV